MRIRRILVPIDFSEPSLAALRYARDLSATLKGRVHLLHVIAIPYLTDPWGTEATALRMAKLMADSETEARKALAGLARRARFARPARLVVTTGTPVQEILKYTAAGGIDLIVMGTHGRGFVDHFLLGSVAERVVHHSTVPVVTVHGRGRRRASGRTSSRKQQPGGKQPRDNPWRFAATSPV